MAIGQRIRQLREERGLTQDELAKRCGYKSRSSINKIELSRSLPLDKVEIIAKALSVPPGYLMGWDDDTQIDYVVNTSTSENLTPNEQIIIERYRSIPEDKKSEFLGQIFAYSEALMKGGSE